MKAMKREIFLSLLWIGFCCAGQAIKDRFIKVYFPDGFTVTAELAITDEERQQGLMFRQDIRENQAMLFIFEEEGLHSFWMKNMRFPIDIIWLDKDKRIIHIEPKVPACQQDPCPSYSPGRPAKYVLELQSGCAEKHGLRLDDNLAFILSRSIS
jgi:uncharacterized membrane protein (UPF0127 family)